MSTHSIVLVPQDPDFVPTEAAATAARLRLSAVAPKARELKAEQHGRIVFFDCGENFERILCPGCQAELTTPWWHERMDADYSGEPKAAGGFTLSRFETPCCGTSTTLNDLVYEWPQGFGRFSLSAIDPDIGTLSLAQQEELETMLGTRLRVIYRML